MYHKHILESVGGKKYTMMANSFNRSQQDAIFLNFIFDIQLYMFRTDLVSIIGNLDTVFTAIGICYAIYVHCLKVGSRQHKQYDKYQFL